MSRWSTRGAALALAVVVSAGLPTLSPSPALAGPTAVDELVVSALRTPVEARYSGRGGWDIAVSEIKAPASAVTYRTVHPRNLGARGVDHPILTWGNGTNSTTLAYPGVFEQLASWGFVVIGSNDLTQGSGESMLSAVRELIAADADPASPFFDALDTDNIGALGHSQGAGGAINAALKAGGLIDTVVPINLPDQNFVGGPARFSAAELQASTFLLGGGADTLFAPPTSLRAYYEQMPRVVLGVLRNADHLTIQYSGGGYLGYLTAWMRWQLSGDRHAARAFTGADPEMRRNPHWQDHLAKGVL
ncbi:MAG: poly(ethylene terephthalate) hydrolase family protein [Sporichthyaceae bacterium]